MASLTMQHFLGFLNGLNTTELVLLILSLAGGLIVYFTPAIVGWNKKSAFGITILNLLLGWTLLGWVGALVWALSSAREERGS